jgi:5-methylcytosine-specific restriction endonuclease McrA
VFLLNPVIFILTLKSRYNMGRQQTTNTRQKQADASRAWIENLKKDPIAWNEYRERQAEGTKKRFQNKEENRIKYLTETPFCELGIDARRDKIIFDQQGKCGKCNNKEWLGSTLTLEIDHINGNHQDNRRDNLIAICPNCHSITPTWRGRNKGSCKRVSDEEAILALKSEPTIRQALIKVGLTPRGGNYKRFTKLKDLC